VRAVVQRVAQASIEIADEASREARREMGAGLLVLLGVGRNDTEQSVDDLVRKILGLRIFEDETGRMNFSLLDTGGELGVVSQFTLWGDTRKGRRPSFNEAAPPDVAAPLIETFARKARDQGVRVITGKFGARMEVALTNSGPVTLWVDSEGRNAP